MKFSMAAAWHTMGRDPGLINGDGMLKSLQPVQRRVLDHEARIMEFIITTDTRDRMGDTIAADGWGLEHYEKNPVVLWAHDYGHPPIGKSLEVNRSETGLVSRAQFADTETKGAFLGGKDVFDLYAGGFLHATSVGFLPTAEPTKAFDEDEKFLGFDFKAQELLEYSAVPVPANPEALALGLKGGHITPRAVMALYGADLHDTPPSGENPHRETVRCATCEERVQRESRERTDALLGDLAGRFKREDRGHALELIARRFK